MIDDRTTTYSLTLPHVDNVQTDDVARLRAALNTIDSILAGKQAQIAYTPENPAAKGAANGYCPLGSDIKVPAIYLPSYVDDVVEVANASALPVTGEGGKIYITLDTNAQWRWSGSAYTGIVSSPGSTDSVPEGAANKYFTNQRAIDAQPKATTSSLGVVKVGSGINVDSEGVISSGPTQTYDEVTITATAGQTVFTPAGGYNPGRADIFLNGVLLYSGIDVTASNGTTITLSAGAGAGDVLLVKRWNTLGVDPVPRTRYIIATKTATTVSLGGADHYTYNVLTNTNPIALQITPALNTGETITVEKGAGSGLITISGVGATLEFADGDTNTMTADGKCITLIAKTTSIWKVLK